jgi:hypothetical protein
MAEPDTTPLFGDDLLENVRAVTSGLAICVGQAQDDGRTPWAAIEQVMYFVLHFREGSRYDNMPQAQRKREICSMVMGNIDGFTTVVTTLCGRIQEFITALSAADRAHEELYVPQLLRARAMIVAAKKGAYEGRYVARTRTGHAPGLNLEQGFDPAPDKDTGSDLNTLFSYVQDTLFHCGLKRHNGNVMCSVKTSDGADSHTYECRGTIQDVVYKLLSVDADPLMHKLAIKRSQYESVAKAITRIPDPRFPALTPVSGVYTFEHTVVDMRDPRDVRISPLAELSGDVHAVKFFPGIDAEPAWLTCDFFDIPTPAFSSIFDHQDIPEDAQRYIFAILGRCLFPLNEHDNWQIIPFFRGKAGTGKSTILEHVMAKMFASEDVAFIADECQGFSLSGAVGRRLWIVPEVTARFRLSQADFQQLVSGGALEVRVKHKDSIIVNKWTVPGLMAGNQLPLSMSNNSGSLTRRFNVIPFNRSIDLRDQDAALPSKLGSEMAAIMVKIARAYGSMLERVGGGTLRLHMPTFLSNIMEEVGCAFSPLMSFVAASGKLTLRADLFMTEAAFLDAFNGFCRSTNVEPPQWNADLYDDVFHTHGLRIARAGANRRYGSCALGPNDRIVMGADLASREVFS